MGVTNMLFLDDLNEGDSWISQGRTITETDVVNFAGITGDYDPLHVDHEFATDSPFGRPIAHGLLGLSFVAGLGSHSPSVRTLAFLAIHRWEFVRPTYIGDTVHVRTQIVQITRNGRRSGRVTWKRELVNQSGDVVQAGIFETLVSRTSAAKPRTEPASLPIINPASPEVSTKAG